MLLTKHQDRHRGLLVPGGGRPGGRGWPGAVPSAGSRTTAVRPDGKTCRPKGRQAPGHAQASRGTRKLRLTRQVAWSSDGARSSRRVGITFDIVEVKDSDGKNPRKVQVPSSTLKLWDPSTGKLKRVFDEEKYTSIDAIAFSPG